MVDASGRLAVLALHGGKGDGGPSVGAKTDTVGDRSRQGIDGTPTMAVCPSCGAPINADEGRCEACAAGPTKPSMSALFRLATFARPRAGLVVLGFVLTLAATAAGLVPPYLTIPLLDNVLVPYQAASEAARKAVEAESEGVAHDELMVMKAAAAELRAKVKFNLVWWCLGGLAAAALLEWLLDWAKLYVLAWVSERISADLRAQDLRPSATLVAWSFSAANAPATSSPASATTRNVCAISCRST